MKMTTYSMSIYIKCMEKDKFIDKIDQWLPRARGYKD